MPPRAVRRKEQDFVDQIVSGELSGQYLMLLGPKGTGKSSMVIDAAVKQNADGFAMLECHEDPEVVRLRLGIALDFQYNVSALFSRSAALQAAWRSLRRKMRRRKRLRWRGLSEADPFLTAAARRRTRSPDCSSVRTREKVVLCWM